MLKSVVGLLFTMSLYGQMPTICIVPSTDGTLVLTTKCPVLTGATGPQGPIGLTGAPGPQGVPGLPGRPGVDISSMFVVMPISAMATSDPSCTPNCQILYIPLVGGANGIPIRLSPGGTVAAAVIIKGPTGPTPMYAYSGLKNGVLWEAIVPVK